MAWTAVIKTLQSMTGNAANGQALLVGLTVSAAATLCAYVGPCEKADAAYQQDSSFSASPETQALILGPLQAEMSNLSANVMMDRSTPDLGESEFSRYINDVYGDLRPGASRLAGAALSANSDSMAIEGFMAMQSPSATLVESKSGGRLSVSFYEGRTPSAGLMAMSNAYAEIAGSDADPAGRSDRRMTFRYETGFDSPGGPDGLDVGVSPHAGVSFGDLGPAAQAGATVRLGQYLGERFGEERPAWWVFAGADSQALMINPGAGLNMRNAMAFEPYATVGDAQAGIAARFAGANLSLAYIQRETRYAMPTESWKTSEGFTALSLTLRR